ncbi:MAG: VaFE repeat-containing surface-anchored protein, partial [Olsenella sp.]|nr:VaFE repeat-containing surface-anchored protein [Olsenella sp.]
TADGSLLAGRTVVAFESVSRDGVEVAAHADIDDDGQAVSFPKIGTTATVNGRKEAETGEGITVTDEVRYENLTPGAEYTISGRLVDKSDGATLRGSDGREVTATVTLVAEEASGTVLLDLAPDARDLGDADLVVFEELRKGEQKVAEHADVSDQDQTVHVRPRIATTATDPIDGDHEAPSTGAVRIRDDVGYQGLRPGREYAVNGTLVDRETGRPVTDADGNAVTASRTFSPEAPSGTVDIEFTADGSLLAGRTVVAFESVSRDGVEVAAHADIDDDGQAVSFPKIGTVAKVDSVDSGEQGAEKLTVIDSVHYENLVPNTEYTLKGHLVDKESGGPVGRENGEVAAETTFRTSQSNGTVDVRFEYDRSLTIDSTTVVFESLYKSGQRVAEHADVENEDQSFDTPAIYTTASDMADGDKQVNGLGSVSIQDSVLHRGLERGGTYTLHGRLMDRGTGTPIRDAGGNEITAERTFAAESPDGIVPVEFVCDGRLLSGKTAVIFEDLSRDDKVVARHADMNDEGQSVEGARIQTVARDRADGDKNVSPDGDQAIVDTVSYTGLTPGKTYTLTATLRNKPSSSSSRENSGASDDIDDQSDVLSSGTTTFCPSSSNGTVEVEIACRPKRFAGQDLVVFEKLTTQSDATGEGEGPAVAEHADPDDEDQTVHIDSPSKDMPQTGVDARSFAVGIAGLATVCATVTHLIKRRLCRRRHR